MNRRALGPPPKTKSPATATTPEQQRRRRRTPLQGGGHLESPPDSIRTRLWKLHAAESSWTEVIAVRNAIATKGREIEDCCERSPCKKKFDLNRSMTLQRELDDWTWPARLADDPGQAWSGLSKSAKQRLLQTPQRCRESAWILLNRRMLSGVLDQDIQQALWGEHRSELRRDPAFVRACLVNGVVQAFSTVPLVPTPSILHDRGLVVENSAPDSVDRDLFEATVQGIRRDPTGCCDVLRSFSLALRNDEALMLQTLVSLSGLRLLSHRKPTFVGLRLRDTAVFCLRAAEALSTDSSSVGECVGRRPLRRLLDLSDLSERLRHDAAVVLAFSRVDAAANLALAPRQMLCDADFVCTVCDSRPSAIVHLPPSLTRSGLESSVPFVQRLLQESDPQDLPLEYWEGLPVSIREDREICLAAVVAAQARLVHPRWKERVDFWCDAIGRSKSNLCKCYEQIPGQIRCVPPILDAIVRHPDLCDLHTCDLFEPLLRRVGDSETLRDCVRYAQADAKAWDPSAWNRVPGELWEDRVLCLELLSWLPALYGCLPDRLLSDPDVLAALLAADPRYYPFALLLHHLPAEVQRQHPELVQRILKDRIIDFLSTRDFGILQTRWPQTYGGTERWCCDCCRGAHASRRPSLSTILTTTRSCGCS